MINLIATLKCAERMKQELGSAALTDFEDLEDDAAENRFLIQILAERLVALEAAQNEISERYRVSKSAEEAWSLALRARDRAVFANQAGEVAVVPTALMDLISSGRAADVRVSKVDGGVLLDDEREERAVIPLTFLINLARISRQWESGGLAVSVPAVPRQPDRRESGEEESHD